MRYAFWLLGLVPGLLLALLVSGLATPCLALTDAEHRAIAAEVEALKAELPHRIDASTTMVAVAYDPGLALITYWASVELRVAPEELAEITRRTQPPQTCVNLRALFEAGVSQTWLYTATDGREIVTIYLTRANCQQYW